MDKLDYFKNFEYHLLNDERPSTYFNKLLTDDNFPQEFPYNMIYDLNKVEQEPKHHPEGNVWNHTMEVIDYASKLSGFSRDKRVFMWAAFLHDIGKATTTKVRRGRITAYDHDREGARLANKFLLELVDDADFINQVSSLIRWHMQPLFVFKNLPFAKIEYMIRDTSIAEVAILGLCDRFGRGPMSEEKENEIYRVIKKFLIKCRDKVEDVDERIVIEKIINILSDKLTI